MFTIQITNSYVDAQVVYIFYIIVLNLFCKTTKPRTHINHGLQDFTCRKICLNNIYKVISETHNNTYNKNERN